MLGNRSALEQVLNTVSTIICMLLLFILLLFLHKVSPHRLLPVLRGCLRPAVNWSLSTVGIFMTPSFITHIGLICAWFFPPILITWTIDILLCKCISKAIPFPEADVTNSSEGHISSRSRSRSRVQSRAAHMPSIQHAPYEDERWIPTPEPEESGSEDEEAPRQRAVTLDAYSPQIRPINPRSSLPEAQCQLSKNETREIGNAYQDSGTSGTLQGKSNATFLANPATSRPHHERHSETAWNEEQGSFHATQEGIASTAGETCSSGLSRGLVAVNIVPEPISTPAPLPDVILSQKLSRLVDLVIYVIIFLVGVVLFYTPGGENRSQVIFIAMISLIWLFSRRIIPHSWTKVLHPTLTTSLLASFGILGIGSTRGLNRQQTYDFFYKEITYLDFLDPSSKEGIVLPGAGDMLESILDAGTVGLAFTIFDYRRDLYHNFFRIFLVVLPNCVLSLLLWPYLARQIGVLPEQAMDWAGRSMSAPLALELLKATRGDRNLGAVMVYLTSIAVTVFRTPMFRLFRIRTASAKTHEDYFTIGVSVGALGGVIGTSGLFKRHRRAAGTATIALVIYAIIMLCLVSIPIISQFIDTLIGR
ncbi:LrgB-like family-domain-containing protein [Melampsora americana]|nr:LrgB-like family-domain-containing protein [Melampsora americana]